MKDITPAPPEVGTPERSAPGPNAPLPPSRKADPPRPGGKRWLWLVLLLIAGAAAYYLWPRATGASDGGTPNTQASPGQTGKAGKGGRGGFGNVPVVAVKAIRGSIGEYITGLGNVTPIYTVTVKTRVDGQLMNVYYKEGDLVEKGAPLAQVDPRPFEVQLEQAEGALMRDQALLANARVDLTRYEGLLKQNAIPEQQYATQKALVAQDEGVVKADQGQIDNAKLNLTYCNVTAPITGRIGLRLVDPGNIVHAADATGLLVITQVQPISVIFPIAEDQLPLVFPRFRAGQKLAVEAWDRDQEHKLDSGTLATLDNQIDQTTATVRLRADFPNPHEALYPNQFVYVRLLVQEKRGVTLIPTAAVQRTTTNTYVYLIKPDSTVTVQNISIGTTEGDESQVLSGLAPGDEIVLTGVDKLNEGSKVTAQLETWTPRTGPAGDNSRGGQGGNTLSPAGGQPGGRTGQGTPNGVQPGRSGGQSLKGPGGKSQ